MQVLTTASFPHRYGPLARLGVPNTADRSAEAEHGGHGAVASTSRRPERSALAKPTVAEVRAHEALETALMRRSRRRSAVAEVRAHEALETALVSALGLLSTGVRSLVALACRRTHWPRVLWREHLPPAAALCRRWSLPRPPAARRPSRKRERRMHATLSA